MITALLHGLGTAAPLVVGAAVGQRWHVPRPVLAVLMAFGAGTMIAAASEELFGPAFQAVSPARAAAALLLGAGVYVSANYVLDRRAGSGAAVGWGLMLGAALDGVPENTALGVSLGSGGVVLLVAIAVGNLPEAVGSAATFREAGISPRRGLALWSGVGVLLVAVTVLAHALSDTVGAGGIATAQAFAGGATLAVLADTLMPEAYREGGWWVGLATALGFLTSYLLG